MRAYVLYVRNRSESDVKKSSYVFYSIARHQQEGGQHPQGGLRVQPLPRRERPQQVEHLRRRGGPRAVLFGR